MVLVPVLCSHCQSDQVIKGVGLCHLGTVRPSIPQQDDQLWIMAPPPKKALYQHLCHQGQSSCLTRQGRNHDK